MKICEPCHTKDRDVIGCDKHRFSRHPGVYEVLDCEICGKSTWVKDCEKYDSHIDEEQ